MPRTLKTPSLNQDADMRRLWQALKDEGIRVDRRASIIWRLSVSCETHPWICLALVAAVALVTSILADVHVTTEARENRRLQLRSKSLKDLSSDSASYFQSLASLNAGLDALFAIPASSDEKTGAPRLQQGELGEFALSILKARGATRRPIEDMNARFQKLDGQLWVIRCELAAAAVVTSAQTTVNDELCAFERHHWKFIGTVNTHLLTPLYGFSYASPQLPQFVRDLGLIWRPIKDQLRKDADPMSGALVAKLGSLPL
jgi:hypothetical protein